MSDLPSERSIWNVKIIINLILLGTYLTLLVTGVQTSSLTTTEALSLLGSTALGGGIGWLAK